MKTKPRNVRAIHGIIALVAGGVLGWCLIFHDGHREGRGGQPASPLGDPPASSQGLGVSLQQLPKQMTDFYNTPAARSSKRTDGADAPPLRGPLARLARLLRNPGFNLRELDAAFRECLLDNNIPRESKVRTLWELANELEGERKLYTLDALCALRPIELTEEVAQAFRETTDPRSQSLLLAMLKSSLDIANPEVHGPDQLAFIGAQSETIESFFKEQARTALDDEVRRYAILSAPNVLPPDDAAALLNELTAESSRQPSAVPVSKGELMTLWLETSLATPETQDSLLPQVVGRLAAEPQLLEDGDFRDRLYAYVAAAEMEPSAKPLLQSFLESAKPAPGPDAAYYHWLNAYAATSINGPANQSERAVFLAQHLPTAPLLGQAGVLAYGPAEVAAHLSQQQTATLMDNFGVQLQQPEVSSEAKALFTDAMTVLSTHIAGIEN